MRAIYITNYPPLLNDNGRGININYEQAYNAELDRLVQEELITLEVEGENENYLFDYEDLGNLLQQIENDNLTDALADAVRNIADTPQEGL